MIIPYFLYFSIWVSWWIFIFSWSNIKEKIGNLIYPVAILMFSLIVVSKTEDHKPPDWEKIEVTLKEITSPLNEFICSHSALEVCIYFLVFCFVISMIPMIPFFIDEFKYALKDWLRKK